MPTNDSKGSLPALDSSGDVGGAGASDGVLRAFIKEVAAAPPVEPRALLAFAHPESLLGECISHFRIERFVGRGGLGVVFEARDLTLDRRVAIKILSPAAFGSRGASSDPLHEARVAAKVSHQTVAAIYEAGADGGTSFIAMEFVDGETLRSVLRRGPLPFGRVILIAEQIALGLGKAHEQGVVHRDLKPENIAIAEDNRVKILDFGIAQQLGESERREGTPLYVAKEQWETGVVDARADVYSLGVVMLECLLGESGVRELLCLPHDFLVHEAHARLPLAVSPAPLLDVALKCIEPSPAARFRDGGDVANALHGVAMLHTRRRRSAPLWAIGLGAVGLLTTGVAVLREARTPTPTAAPAPSPHEPKLRRITANVAERPILGMGLSPDGKTLAYSDEVGLHVLLMGSSDSRVLPFEPGVKPLLVKWFRDGKRLAVVVQSSRDARELRILDVASSGTRTVARGDFTSLAISPDDRRLAYAAGNVVGVIDVDHPDAQRELVAKHKADYVDDVCFSPNGERIAYVSLSFDSLASTTLETVPTSGGESTVVMTESRLFNDVVRAGLAWLPDGDLLVSMSEWLPAEQGTNLFRVTLDKRSGVITGTPTQVTHWQGITAVWLSLDQSGDNLAFVRYETHHDIFLGDLTAKHELVAPPVRLTMSDRNQRRPAWSPDGRGIYYQTDEGGSFGIFFQGLDQSPPLPVVASELWETSPVVDPSGERLLYWQLAPVPPGVASRADLMIRELDGGGLPIRLLSRMSVPAGTGRPPPWEVRIRCPRGERNGGKGECVESEIRDGNTVLFRLHTSPKAGGQRETIRTIEGTGIWDLSPDGMRIAIPTPSGPLRIESLADPNKDVLSLPLPAGCEAVLPEWSHDEQGVFVTAECNTEPTDRVYFVPLIGKPSLVFQDRANFALEAEPSPDGRHLAMVVKRTDDDVWVVSGLSGRTD